ncbi:hypothetical protein [Haloplanus natans]|nr:hypothetical protein [Haloplanus natans]
MHPKQSVEAVQSAWRLWSDETTAGTVAAVILVAIFVGWPTYRLWKASR